MQDAITHLHWGQGPLHEDVAPCGRRSGASARLDAGQLTGSCRSDRGSDTVRAVCAEMSAIPFLGITCDLRGDIATSWRIPAQVVDRRAGTIRLPSLCRCIA